MYNGDTKLIIILVQHFRYTANYWHEIAFKSTGRLWCKTIDEFNFLPLQWFPHKRPSMQSYIIYFLVAQNKLLNKQSECQPFETKWRSSDVTVYMISFIQ